jgi:carboxypeptidase family protein
MRISEQFSCKPRSPGIVLTIFLLFATGMIANAQQGGMISGRVVNDEGEGLANVNIRFTRILTGRRVDRDGGNTKTITENDGNFRATGLAPGLYSVDVSNTKEYAMKPLTSAERRVQRYYRTGDNITIELVKGGVITGKVTNSDGRPMVEVEVSETMVRDAEGHALRGSRRGEPRMTDDRGIYRMFRLQPGSYIISTNGRKMFGPTDDDSVTTYHPSSTFDTATEVTVTSGSEITGVDIRIRDDPGYVVSGTVTASSVTPSSVYIDLISTNLSSVAQSTGFRPDSRKGFIIEGVTNGDYEIMAFGRDNNNELVAASTPRRITVSGADVPGLELKLSALASLSGQILIEASSDPCENKSKRALEEIMICAQR